MKPTVIDTMHKLLHKIYQILNRNENYDCSNSIKALNIGEARQVEEEITLDINFYGNYYSDLKNKTTEELVLHYLTHGENEGRLCSPLALRGGLIHECSMKKTILELGPFVNPILTGKNVFYFDVMDRECLIERAKSINLPYANAPYIDFVSPDGDLTIVKNKYQAIVGCHNIEHYPDLIFHLQTVFDALENGGAYFLIIPDKRYCFDHYIPEKTIADVIQANFEGRRIHTLASVIEHRALTTHNNSKEHWEELSGTQSINNIASRIISAQQEFLKANGSYIDVHAWQFTPRSFFRIVKLLSILNIVPIKKIQVFSTPKDNIEFTAILSK